MKALTVFDDGNGSALYAGGRFTNAGGVPSNRVAKWDGTEWFSLGFVGGGMNADVNDLEVYDDGNGPALYACGSFTVAGTVLADRIARWDGTGWSAVGGGVQAGFLVTVNALAVFDDGAANGSALYIGGLLRHVANTPARNIAKWDGSEWSTLGNGFDDEVSAIEIFDDGSGAGPALYAAGTFTGVDGELVDHIAKWDGSNWAPLGSGVDLWVHDLAVFDDGNGPALYAAGEFFQAGGAPRPVSPGGTGRTGHNSEAGRARAS